LTLLEVAAGQLSEGVGPALVAAAVVIGASGRASGSKAAARV
jgi:hypothetical protein